MTPEQLMYWLDGFLMTIPNDATAAARLGTIRDKVSACLSQPPLRSKWNHDHDEYAVRSSE